MWGYEEIILVVIRRIVYVLIVRVMFVVILFLIVVSCFLDGFLCCLSLSLVLV